MNSIARRQIGFGRLRYVSTSSGVARGGIRLLPVSHQMDGVGTDVRSIVIRSRPRTVKAKRVEIRPLPSSTPGHPGIPDRCVPSDRTLQASPVVEPPHFRKERRILVPAQARHHRERATRLSVEAHRGRGKLGAVSFLDLLIFRGPREVGNLDSRRWTMKLHVLLVLKLCHSEELECAQDSNGRLNGIAPDVQRAGCSYLP